MKKLLLPIVMLLTIILYKGPSVEATSESIQNVTIERFRTQAKSIDETVSFSKATVEIYYYDSNDEKRVLETMETDESGYIKNVSLELPTSPKRNQLFFRYVLKNDRYGCLVDKQGMYYRAITSCIIPESKVITIDTDREFPNASKVSSAVKTWNMFPSIVDEVQTSIHYAEEVTSFRIRNDFEFEPIPIQYEKGEKLDNSFNIAQANVGVLSKGMPYISINDEDIGSRVTNLAHEWSHWVMYRSLNGFDTGGGNYSGHYTVNNSRISWKEGWAVAQANLISTVLGDWPYGAYQFGRKVFDTSPQEHQVTGKSTISTVNGVLIDIFDKDYTYNGLEGVNEEEFYDLASDYSKSIHPFNPEQAFKDGRLANGLMVIAMVNSKATTLSEYIHYLKSSEMIKNTKEFENMLALNGISSDGNYIEQSIH